MQVIRRKRHVFMCRLLSKHTGSAALIARSPVVRRQRLLRLWHREILYTPIGGKLDEVRALPVKGALNVTCLRPYAHNQQV